MRTELFHVVEEPHYTFEQMKAFTEDGIEMSHVGIITTESRFCGKYIPTQGIGGVGTEPEYRRNGCVRVMLEDIFRMAPDRGWAVSLLHPFSTAYYRKFGYEKIADHKVVEFSMASLSHIPRCPDLVPYDSSRLPHVLSLYEAFSAGRNIMFRRFDERHYSTNGRKIYIRYDRTGAPAGYVILRPEKVLEVNHMVSVNLHVDEMVFTTPESLLDLFGFLRMYEGELDSVKIHNCAMAPEIDDVLSEYIGAKYTLIPDISARVLDVKAMLEANEYPAEAGHFRIFVDDTLNFTRGLWEVEYGGGKGEAKRLSGEDGWDIFAPMPAFSRILYGYEQNTAERAVFMPGVRLSNACPDFFRAFPKRYNGLFEHF